MSQKVIALALELPDSCVDHHELFAMSESEPLHFRLPTGAFTIK